MPPSAVPRVPAVPEPSTEPVRTAVTLRLAAAVSTSVSLVSTEPVALLPAVPLAVPPASTAMLVSLTPTGASLTGTTVM